MLLTFRVNYCCHLVDAGQRCAVSRQVVDNIFIPAVYFIFIERGVIIMISPWCQKAHGTLHHGDH